MREVHGFIAWGLGKEWSNGIIYRLAQDLANEGVNVRVGSYADYQHNAAIIRTIPLNEDVFLVGHSLGASSAPELARLSGRRIDAIFGFDAADNIGANISEYRLTPVPRNVRVGYTVFVPGGALGGGSFVAEDPNATPVENHARPGASHGDIEEAVAEHLKIVAFARRSRADETS